MSLCLAVDVYALEQGDARETRWVMETAKREREASCALEYRLPLH